MDTGGPITMTYNNHNNVFPMATGLGAPGAGFASRGKATGLKRLQLAAAPKVGSISENPLGVSGAEDGSVPAPLTGTQDRAPTPRTSRSHLLAGLRTQPRTPSTLSSVSSSIHAAAPASAPYYKTTHNPPSFNVGAGQYPQSSNTALPSVPHTAIGSNFPSLVHQQHQSQSRQQQFSINPGQQFYTLPEQVLAPPPLDIDEADDQMDPEVVRQLYATEMYLAQRQQQLQLQIAALNGQGMKFNQTSFPQTPITPQQFGLYNQPQVYNQIQNIPGSAIFTQELAGQPGVYVVYNALTGQSTLAVDQNLQQQAELANSPPPPTPSQINTNFMVDQSTGYRRTSPVGGRSISPPKKSISPDVEVQPLPPPSANAFRRGHTRNRSSLVLNPTTGVTVTEGPKSAVTRPVGIPATPMTGTFGPGQARAGEHPIRQPIGPPSIEELKEKPTTKFEGSKNFATRQRRRALNKLVRAGMERRVATGSASTTRPGSGGSLTPVSDNEATFSPPTSSDNESDIGSVGKLSAEIVDFEKLNISEDSMLLGQIVN